MSESMLEEDPELDALNDALDDDATGCYLRDANGTIVWCAFPAGTCGGTGVIACRCGGDLCACGNRGEIDCDGCVDCDEDDDAYD